jgi:cation diffusion facilitator family transporter
MASIGAALATIALKGHRLADDRFGRSALGCARIAGQSGRRDDGPGDAALAERPAHAFGHGKAEYFSSGFEGLLILLRALAIAFAAIDRLLNRSNSSAWAWWCRSASLINLVVGRVLLRAGKRHRSITLEADAHHLLTDVWTSAGVIVGLTAVALTGWLWLDPTLALLVATNIVWTGWRLLQRSAVQA